MRGPAGIAVCVLGVVATATGSLAAPRGPGRAAGRPIEVPAGQAPVRAERAVSFAPPGARAAGPWAGFLAREGPDWRAIWDADTGVPLRIYGAGIRAPGSSGSPARAARAARAILERHIDLLAPGTRASDFALVANHEAGGLRTVGFAQSAGGVPVLGGQVSVRIRRDRVLVIASEVVPGSGSPRPAGAASARSRDLARRRARDWIAAVLSSRSPGASSRSLAAGPARGPFVLPLVRRRGAAVHTVLEVAVASERPLVRATVWVDAESGEPVARRDDLRSASGVVRFDAPVRWPGDERRAYPAPFASLILDGEPATTDLAGQLAWPGDATGQLVTTATGPYVSVIDHDQDPASAELLLPDGGEVVWSEADSEGRDAQLAIFVHGNLVVEFARALDPGLAWLDQSLQAHANLDGTCNAFSDRDSIYFFRGGAACENTGRIADIIYHEYGHSLHAQSLLPGVGRYEEALSEGASDYLAATITGDPAMARGFYRNELPLRHIDPEGSEAIWPEDIGVTPHATGLIFAGAMWDLRKALALALGEAEGAARADHLFYQVLRRASDIPSSYAEVLAADDDDGDLSNGTPHACAIDAAFGRHGLADPVATGQVAPPLVRDLEVSVAVTPPLRDCPELLVTGARLEWQLRAAPDVAGALDMAPIESGFAAAIPEPPAASVVQYRIQLELASGERRALPGNPADPWYELFHGAAEVLYCTGFDDAPRAEGWTSGSVGEQAVDEWSWGAPLGSRSSGDPDRAFSGYYAFGTDLGGFQSDGAYEPEQVAYADLPVLSVPPDAVSVHLQYRRWLAVEDGRYDRASIAGNGALAWANLETGSGLLHHVDREWRFHDVDLTDVVVDDQLAIRFELTSDETIELGGWTLDEVCVVAVRPTCGGEDCAGGDAGPGGILADDGGCGCRTGGRGGGLPWLAFGLCAALWQLGRHRRRMPGHRAPV
jgi:hypothetical protein